MTLEYETWYFLLAAGRGDRQLVHQRAPTVTRRDLAIVGAIALGYVALIKAFVMVY